MITLVFTRPARRLKNSIKIAENAGFNVIAAPSLDIVHGEIDDYKRIEKNLSDKKYKFAIFSSATAVEECSVEWNNRFSEIFSDVNIVAIGPKTASTLADMGLNVFSIPSEYTSSGLVNHMCQHNKCGVLIVHSDHGSPLLDSKLKMLGFATDELVAYRLKKHEGDLDEIRDAILSEKVDVFAFTSRMSVESFADSIKIPIKKILEKVKVACIGTPTADKLKEYGVKVDIVPESATFSHLIDAILEHFNSKSD
ncbi:MAG: uroporphyrinogen-III synthase [archaeon]|nr:uroporphyrinogen-III synthase [archaeon]